MTMHHRLRVAVAAVLAVSVDACLEGDPNPLKQGGPTAAITPGSSGSSGSSGEPAIVQPSGTCSKASTEAVTLTFKNQAPTVSISLSWVDFQCREIVYSTLAPGAAHEQPTFVGHVWRLRDANTGALYKEFIPTSVLPATVTVP